MMEFDELYIKKHKSTKISQLRTGSGQADASVRRQSPIDRIRRMFSATWAILREKLANTGHYLNSLASRQPVGGTLGSLKIPGRGRADSSEGTNLRRIKKC